MSMMAWQYAKLVNNRLVDSEYGGEVNINFPNFYSVEEAEAYLMEHDIHATVVDAGPRVVGVVPKYPEYIMKFVRMHHGLEDYDNSQDKDINDMSHDEVLDACLEWEGIMGYGYTIRSWIKDIYGVKLE